MVSGMGAASEKDAEKIADAVRMAQKGSQDAFMELYQLFYHELYAYACYMLHHKQDAEDVVADTIVAAYESIGRLRDVYRFRQWLFKILSNKCRKKLKSYAERNKHHSRGFDGETVTERIWRRRQRTGSGSGMHLRFLRMRSGILSILFCWQDTGVKKLQRTWE